MTARAGAACERRRRATEGEVLAGGYSWRASSARCGAAGSNWRCVGAMRRACSECLPGSWVTRSRPAAWCSAWSARRCSRSRRRGGWLRAGAAGGSGAADVVARRGRTAGCRACARGGVTSIPAGELVAGAGVAWVVARARRAARGGAGGRACRCARSASRAIRRTPRRGTVTLVRRDPLAGMVSVPWPHRDAAELSLWEPIPVGVDELGETVIDRAAGAQRAAGRRARRGQVRRALAARGDRGARSVRAAVAAGRQAGGAVGVGAVRATARGPGRR